MIIQSFIAGQSLTVIVDRSHQWNLGQHIPREQMLTASLAMWVYPFPTRKQITDAANAQLVVTKLCVQVAPSSETDFVILAAFQQNSI